MKTRKKPYFKAFFQIFVMIVATVAISYFAHESSLFNTEEQTRNKIDFSAPLFLLKMINKMIWNEKSIVSAQDLIQTCMKTTDGRTCMGYASAQCAANCEESCIPSEPKDIAECEIGTCFDPFEGTCVAGTPKKLCEDGEGEWFDDPNGNIQQCKKGCCLAGNEARFATERECTRTSEILGIAQNFKPEVNSESACLALRAPEIEGACVLGKDSLTGKNFCKFVTKESCAQLKGDFHENVLCSNPELSTNCEKQVKTGCFEEEYGVYWLDSCNNKENIYDANNVKSWNDGRVLSKSQSCSLGTSSNPFANQGTCGNCNYFRGSVCGNKTATQKLSDNLQNVVCRDLSCVDEDGKKWDHGESWCEYQSSIGVDESTNRATDVPGSRHIRKICWEGQIQTEPCQDFRNSICVQRDATSDGKTFSMAACKINSGVMCLKYNTEEDTDKRFEECAANSDCFIKSVYIGSKFNFRACAPRYPLGFDLEKNPEGAMVTCGLGNQRCTVLYVKTLAHGWTCKGNCNCEEEVFTQQMNDLCMSLGDCGASVSVDGKISTEGYSVSGAPRLGAGYLNGLKKYSEPVPGKVADPGNLTIFGGLPNDRIEAGQIIDPLDREFLQSMNTISGIGGMVGMLAYTLGAAEVSVVGGAAAAYASPTVATETAASSVLGTVGAGIAGAAIGAMVAYSAISMIIQKTGVAPGLPPALINSLLGVGAAAGAVIGYSVFAYGSAATLTATSALGAIPVVGIVILILIVIFISVMKIIGIGKTRERVVSFNCNPWLPAPGGKDCSSCGESGRPCSKYACQSLGVTCRFLDEGTGKERCEGVDPGDVSAPKISPLQSALSENFEYTEVTDLGVKVISKQGDGCIPLYTPVFLGVGLDKIGRCKYDVVPDVKYEDMEFAFSSGLYNMNHTIMMSIPSPEGEDLPEYDPDRRADYRLFVRCANGNGYENPRDYVIEFCVKPGQDITPPSINLISETRYAKYGATGYNASIFTNEPAECKWDSSDKVYSMMLNKMDCANNLSQQQLFGWRCNAELPVAKDENKFYIRCMDKPFENDTLKRNTNSESRILAVKKSAKLEISSVQPANGTITAGVEPVSVKVSLTTSGGVDGTAKCSYSFDGTRYIDFLDTLGTNHAQVFESFTSGRKKIMLRCEDLAGNIAEKTISFNVAVDTTPPKITRVYSSAGSLFIRTNEPAECAMSQDKCTFEFINASLMAGSGTEHYGTVDKNVVYYVKCKDRYDNMQGRCDLTVKAV